LVDLERQLAVARAEDGSHPCQQHCLYSPKGRTRVSVYHCEARAIAVIGLWSKSGAHRQRAASSTGLCGNCPGWKTVVRSWASSSGKLTLYVTLVALQCKCTWLVHATQNETPEEQIRRETTAERELSTSSARIASLPDSLASIPSSLASMPSLDQFSPVGNGQISPIWANQPNMGKSTQNMGKSTQKAPTSQEPTISRIASLDPSLARKEIVGILDFGSQNQDQNGSGPDDIMEL